jgi:ribonucleoside-diphosphate reductase beta chain
MVASCMLETALFYSGFFYPLYLAGKGVMTNTAEIFRLIIRDEAVHGVYVSMLANNLFSGMDEDEKEEAVDWFLETSHDLYINEIRYTEYLYNPLGSELIHETKKFLRFNFNNLCDNLDMERMFDDEEILASVKNGLSTTTKTHDFFSQKGSGYQKIVVEPLLDEDFDFGDVI